MTKPQITVRISPSLLTSLNQYVESTGTSKTDVVISAIAQYLGNTENVPLNQRVAELEAQMKELTALIKSDSDMSKIPTNING